jgi:hypothetical protein
MIYGANNFAKGSFEVCMNASCNPVAAFEPNIAEIMLKVALNIITLTLIKTINIPKLSSNIVHNKAKIFLDA